MPGHSTWSSGGPGAAHLHVHPDMLWKAADEELGQLARGDVAGVTRHRREAIDELLHSGDKRQLAQLGQTASVQRWPKPVAAQPSEVIPWWHALVLLESVVPRLGRALEVVGGETSKVGRGSVLPKELVTLVEPIQEINGAVEGGELQLVEFGRRQLQSCSPVHRARAVR